MSKNKFYAVRKGKKTGIFRTWKECKELVYGYPKAEYKSFITLEEAQLYLRNKKIKDLGKDIKDLNVDEMIAYVDGSFSKDINYYAYGVITFFNGKKEIYSGRGNSKEMLKMRNVAGEIEGAKLAMDIAFKENFKCLYLYYDYMGIEKWCTGEWKANTMPTKEYQKYFNSIKHKLDVKFIKVKSHTGNLYNEEVDTIAKQALHGQCIK